MVERTVVGLLRIAVRLLRREEIAPEVLASLQILLMIKPEVIHSVSICQQVSYGLHDLLRTNAANIHASQDWYTLFMLLEVVGAGVNPPPVLQVNSGTSVADGVRDAGKFYENTISVLYLGWLLVTLVEKAVEKWNLNTVGENTSYRIGNRWHNDMLNSVFFVGYVWLITQHIIL